MNLHRVCKVWSKLTRKNSVYKEHNTHNRLYKSGHSAKCSQSLLKTAFFTKNSSLLHTNLLHTPPSQTCHPHTQTTHKHMHTPTTRHPHTHTSLIHTPPSYTHQPHTHTTPSYTHHPLTHFPCAPPHPHTLLLTSPLLHAEAMTLFPSTDSARRRPRLHHSYLECLMLCFQ